MWVHTEDMAADEIHDILENALTTWGTDQDTIHSEITHIREALAAAGYEIVLTGTIED